MKITKEKLKDWWDDLSDFWHDNYYWLVCILICIIIAACFMIPPTVTSKSIVASKSKSVTCYSGSAVIYSSTDFDDISFTSRENDIIINNKTETIRVINNCVIKYQETN